VHAEGGQATVEWVALVLAAAMVLGAAGALAGREADRGLGKELAERISRTAAGAGPSPDAAAAPPVRVAPPATRVAPPASRVAPPGSRVAPPGSRVARPGSRVAPPGSRAAPPPASGPRAVDASRSLRGIAGVAKRAWILCLGYQRWKHELEHPAAPTEALPVDVALSIANTCLNPHDYLLED
jgi:hypothetical protein